MVERDVKSGCVFSFWEVLYLSEKPRYAHCVCKKCGAKKEIYIQNLLQGKSKQCKPCSLKTHGLSHTRIYNIWENIIQRTSNPHSDSFYLYGERNISICKEWRNDFKCFYEWSMNNGYKENLTIDRINNNGNYEPNNCRWITNKAQQNNRNNNQNITYLGITKTIAEWAEYTGISSMALYHRFSRGWSIERMLTQPLQSKSRR